jgi:excisionase family DNA binding protein
MKSEVVEEAVHAPEVLLYKVKDVARVLNISRTVVFDQLRTGRLQSVKQGRTRLIPATAIRDYVALLIRESQDAA